MNEQAIINELFNIIKELQAIIAEKDIKITDLKGELDIAEKMIDEMANYIGQDIRCIRPEIECNKMTHDCRDCVKEYFRKKVSNE